MIKLLATIKKDLRILMRDRIGLILMFGMPILLVLIVTSIQNNVFQPFSRNKVLLIVNNLDTGSSSRELIRAVDQVGLFRIEYIRPGVHSTSLLTAMPKDKALLGLVIPAGFSAQMAAAAKEKAGKALHSFGLEGDTAARPSRADSLKLLFNPGIEPSLKLSAAGAINGAIQMVESRQIIRNIYYSVNEKPLPDSLASQMLSGSMGLKEIAESKSGTSIPLNATQHNVPAWTIFAMFFVVMSLGGSVVREKLNGSFIRLKTLPTNYIIALLSKQITYLGVTFLQAVVLFGMGVWLFPFIGLPALSLPQDGPGLVLVTLLVGWCAVSYAILVGVVARTQEQANGFGAVSVVILSIIGGLMIPSFIMPGGFQTIMQFSPLHWALQSYYGLFLEGGKLKDILINILPLLVITVVIQLAIVVTLKRKKLI
jgi:ABC-2 type transport system permease protein